MAHIRDETSFEDESSDNRDDEKLLSEDTQLDYGRQKGKSRVIVLSLAFGIITNLLWTLLLTVLTWKTLYQSTTYSSSGPALSERPNLICSLASGVIEYEVVETNTTIDSSNIYMGKPRPEQTLAWEDITKRNIAVSKEDLDLINMTSIELADGSGYMATLEVFHHVHCLDFIRMYVFRDYYDTHESEKLRWQHVDHCIEVLRESVMCHGDVSLLTWQWVDKQEIPFANFNVKHECRNWDNILEWTKQHQVAPEAIVRPADQHWPPHKHDIE